MLRLNGIKRAEFTDCIRGLCATRMPKTDCQTQSLSVTTAVMRMLPLVIAALTLAAPARANKGGEERWEAFSNTAEAITGDILLSPTRLRAAGHDFPLKVVADLPRFGGEDGPVAARVLKVTKTVNPKLLNGNRLGCGHPIQWIVVWRLRGGYLQPKRGKMLEMAVFEGSNIPKSVDEPGLCGTFSYTSPDWQP